ncbi:hypothetical protein ACH4SP_15275 [Streptomyces sp. NPDC021093]|uniref:hypothetical protein n=1 Tax=Streptomyces sp. NPDC021093 TaxID=3365112 RepID=UPI00378D69F1
MNDGRDGREERHGRENPPTTDGSDFSGFGGSSGSSGSSGFGGSGGGTFGADTRGAHPGHGFGTGHGSQDPGTRGAPGTPALSPDELAVRRLMHGAVEGLAPSDGALDHLRRAVPLRRARRRQAVVGVAAAALLIGTAVPAFLHVSRSGGSATANSANAGHSESTQGIESGGTDAGSGGGGERSTEGPQSKDPGKGPGGKDPDGKQKESEAGNPDTGESGTDSGTDGAGAYEQDTTEPEKPACDGKQLEVVKATTGAPDAQGKVYGTFRIANKSGAECAVPGGGSMNFQAMGAADESRIKVVEHTSGDPAAGLPDPAKEARSLVLPPEAAYEVKFAWVPQDTCPSTGVSPDPTPTNGGGDKPGQDAGGTAAGASGGETGGKVPETGQNDTDPTGGGATTQLGTGEGEPKDGKVAVTHTAEPGAPSAEATIPNACAGTIYRTGVLDAP